MLCTPEPTLVFHAILSLARSESVMMHCQGQVLMAEAGRQLIISLSPRLGRSTPTPPTHGRMQYSTELSGQLIVREQDMVKDHIIDACASSGQGYGCMPPFDLSSDDAHARGRGCKMMRCACVCVDCRPLGKSCCNSRRVQLSGQAVHAKHTSSERVLPLCSHLVRRWYAYIGVG